MLKFDMDGQSVARFPGQRRPLLASLRDLWVLAKARVVSLLVFTAAVAGLLGIALAGSQAEHALERCLLTPFPICFCCLPP